jgi:hypothetical protein
VSPLVVAIIDAVAALARIAPDIVSAIQAIVAGGASPEEQAKAIDALKTRLADDVGRVEAVKFRDV